MTGKLTLNVAEMLGCGWGFPSGHELEGDDNSEDDNGDSVARLGLGWGKGAGAVERAVVGGKVVMPFGDACDDDGGGMIFVVVSGLTDVVVVSVTIVMLSILVELSSDITSCKRFVS